MKTYPFFRQLDSMDCGPSCLRMVAAYYGRRFQLADLREMCYANRKAFPYPVEQCNTLYNKLWIAELLLPGDLKSQVFEKLQKLYADVYSDSFQQLIENRQLLKELKAWYRQIFTNSFDLIVRLNTNR